MRLLPLILASIAASPVCAEATTAQFTRILEDAEGRPRALQVAIVTYSGLEDERRLTVDLVGAIHIGDRAYYQNLNDRFRRYDVLLYELIVPGQPDAAQTHSAGANILSGTQTALKNLLGLAFQLDEIDYGAANFVHADLTADQLALSMSERGESLYVYLSRLVIASIEAYASDPLGFRRSRRMSGALASESAHPLKTAMAYEMVDATRAGELLGGPGGSAIIDARNQHAVRVLRNQLDAGATHIGIFYGVAHMRDFERRLLGELGLTRTAIEWVDAWRLAGATDDDRR